jgi:putative transposase
MPNLTYKYRLKGKRSMRLLRRYAWACNQVWNYCVATQRKVQRNHKDGLRASWPSQYELQALTKGTSKDLGIKAQTIQGTCEQFVKSRDLHKKCPRFRRSGGSKRSLGWIPFSSQSRKLGPNFVTYLDHDFHFFGAKRRPLPEVVKGGCFVEDARGRWYVCLHVQVAELPRANEGAVGVDLGLKSIMTLSTGEKIVAPQIFRRYEAQLGIEQRAGNLKRVRAINARIKNARLDFWHKCTTAIVRRFATIYVGDVSSSALAQTKMAKSVLDAGWSIGKNMLRYKASRHGAVYAEVDEKFTTQICSSCGILCEARPRGIADLGIREWDCSGCGSHYDRDVNAARNILAFGQSALPLAEESRVAHGR